MFRVSCVFSCFLLGGGRGTFFRHYNIIALFFGFWFTICLMIFSRVCNPSGCICITKYMYVRMCTLHVYTGRYHSVNDVPKHTATHCRADCITLQHTACHTVIGVARYFRDLSS